ncbi:putative vanadium-dependent bromoperoxidase [Nostoc carneum NIES-2107]|nr:putative vanadium-dependent bromoperoxidase [Nostoc carneum NIES-2107]
MMKSRKQQSEEIRRNAAELAAARPHPRHHNNGDEQRLHREDGKPSYVGNFTKCLPHDDDGFLIEPRDYEQWLHSIDSGDPRDFRTIRLGPGPFQPNGDFQYQNPTDPDYSPSCPIKLNWKASYPGGRPCVRAWESQGAGLTFDLEGPDAQSNTMPPCPSLDSQELIAEMGELYWMALCRDVPFANWTTDPLIDAARNSLKRLWWFRRDKTLDLNGHTDVLPESLARRRILSENGSDPVPFSKLFRGVELGTEVGPYVSQFLLIGNTGINGNDNANTLADGAIAYGAIRIDQQVRVATPNQDYMQTWEKWLDVQNGADVRGQETYSSGYRFIATPRDIVTYVHYDALYQTYLNACLWLLGAGAPFDPGLPFRSPDYIDKQQGFAQFGGPHILSLVTEVATRALKAVRYQKFNVHRRLRPEALGGWMYQRRKGSATVKARLAVLENMEAAFAGSSGIGARLDTKNGMAGNWLLPMAFSEGSPTHPSYGAGHATVAAACVTILKAWFDSGWELKDKNGKPIVYVPKADGSALTDVSSYFAPLTLEGELNKLAANISIGRDWAGVHYYSDYYESFRLGEQVAIGILEEQKLTYGENFSMTVPLLDGTAVRI